jgi:hypothetical protein
MVDAGCFVDVDVPAPPAVPPFVDADFPLPQDISDFGSGLTPEGYVYDEDGKTAQEKDFDYLQATFAGATILLKEHEPLKRGVDDQDLVLFALLLHAVGAAAIGAAVGAAVF